MECLADGVILDGMRVQLRELDLRSRAFVECEVRGVRCRASEAYFGGTVVEPLGVQASSPTGSVEGHPTAGISPTRAIWRLLTFRLTLDEIGSFERNHLQAGLFCTWIVGMGRWWDDPKAHLLQHLGLGSVIYSVVLAALVWIVVAPLRPVRWSYQRVLTFVTMTSPPAILYAIPVERFFDHSTAGQLNLWFLAAVASWRVALLVRFLVTVPGVGWFKGIVAAFLPLSAIVSSLAALNLHRVVFRIMGSIAEHERTAHDAAYMVLVSLTYLAVITFPVLLLVYLGAVVHSRRRTRRGPPGAS